MGSSGKHDARVVPHSADVFMCLVLTPPVNYDDASLSRWREAVSREVGPSVPVVICPRGGTIKVIGRSAEAEHQRARPGATLKFKSKMYKVPYEVCNDLLERH